MKLAIKRWKMKVQIGKYKNWISLYQILDWFKPVLGEKIIDKISDHKYFEWSADFTYPMFQWIHDNLRQRDVKIVIHDFDSWSADHTISLIIVPLLTQLKDKSHSSPMTENKDVPKHLHSTMDADGNDEFVHDRWAWILGEMIWAFTEIRDDKWEEQFHSGVSDIQWDKVDEDELKKMQEEDPDMLTDEEMREGIYEMTLGPADTRKFDAEGYKKHSARIQNGIRLFSKYFFGLWD